jgi:uncharacterized protein YukE
MSEPLGVTPSDLRSTSEHLYDVSTKMKEVLSSLKHKLAAEGAAWGSDSMGDQFAKGEGGYIAQRDWVDKSVEAKTSLLDYYSHGLKRAADSFEQQDET